ncbi:MAG: peptide chain release factor N(5)-glutamine methyltransferase [Candidatus Binatia bacterium]
MDTAAQTDTPADTAAKLVESASAHLADAGIETARLNAEVLLAHACNIDRSALYAGWHRRVPAECRTRFETMLTRRLAREPLQYIVGSQEFWSLDFLVTQDVLIPRPETELLVELALRLPCVGAQHAAPLLCDLGTGTGCIAVALARELPRAGIWAVDLSAAALAVAAANAQRHAVADRIHFAKSDLLVAVADLRFDAIISNPPYVRSDELQGSQPELGWEPCLALDGGASGLGVIERVVTESRPCLKDGGWLIMEIGADQGRAVERLAHAAGFDPVSIRPDYAGLPRALVARR